MLDFIVLGQIPGTNIQITFAWFLFAALCALAYCIHKIKNLQDTHKNQPTQLKLFS